jgi:hypothetical protein
MDRRWFLEKSALAGAGLLLGKHIVSAMPAQKKIVLPRMKLQWCGFKTTRPFMPDVDHNGILWCGSADHFFSLNTKSMNVEQHETAYLENNPFSTCLCQDDKVYILAQKSPHLYMYHSVKKEFSKFNLPDPESNIWFGVRVPNDPRLYLYVRNRGKLLVWDSERETGTEIAYPEKMVGLWSGFYIADDRAIYSFTPPGEPCRLVRFDLQKQQFDAPISAPEPGLEITGVNPIGDTVYCADRFTGRIIPYNFVERQWGKPIKIPGFKKVFGFIGMGTTYNGMALYCLSSYLGSSKWDFDSNKYLSTGEDNIGIDGKPYHFLNKYLVFDPRTQEAGFLEAPETPGKRYPLICYSKVHHGRLFISGYDLGDVRGNLAPIGAREGELCVFHSV